MIQIHDTANVAKSAIIGSGSKVWNHAQVGENCRLGINVIVGQNVLIDDGTIIGDNCKIQNSALIYQPAYVEEGVFIGPGVIFTNDRFPRAINMDGSQKIRTDWNLVGVVVRKGASIGAGSVCVAPIEIGAWALIAAGSIVTSDVPNFALVAGSPAKRINWVGRAGFPLNSLGSRKYICPFSESKYFEKDSNTLVELEG